jgi:hypothetical protein
MINRTADLIGYNTYVGQVTALGTPSMSVTEWQTQTPETKAYLITEAQYKNYENISLNAGITPISLESWLDRTDEQRVSLFDNALDGYVTSKTGELYPKNTYMDKNGNKITGFSDLPKEQQDAFMSGGNEGLQSIISSDMWNTVSGIYDSISNSTGIKSNPYDQSKWDSMPYEQKVAAYNSAISTYSAFLLTETNSVLMQSGMVSGTQYTLFTTDKWDKLPLDEQLVIYSKAIDTYGDSLYWGYKNSVEYVNSAKTENIAMLSKTDWDKLSTDKQITTYNDTADKIAVATAKLEQDYINSLPKESQDYIKTYGLDKFNDAYNNALTQTDPTAQLQVIGLVPNYAKNVKIDKDGQITYEGSPSLKTAKVIDLDSIDYNNLTDSDYYNLIKTLRDTDKYKNMKYDTDVITRFANRELNSVDGD